MSLALLEYESVIQESLFDFEDLIEKFIASIDAKANSKDTYNLTRKDIFAYKEFLVRDGKSAYTISGYLTAVRKFFEWL